MRHFGSVRALNITLKWWDIRIYEILESSQFGARRYLAHTIFSSPRPLRKASFRFRIITGSLISWRKSYGALETVPSLIHSQSPLISFSSLTVSVCRKLPCIVGRVGNLMLACFLCKWKYITFLMFLANWCVQVHLRKLHSNTFQK